MSALTIRGNPLTLGRSNPNCVFGNTQRIVVACKPPIAYPVREIGTRHLMMGFVRDERCPLQRNPHSNIVSEGDYQLFGNSPIDQRTYQGVE